MIRKLNKAERKRVAEQFSGHPLLMACTDVFAPRSGHLNGADIEAEDIFYDVAVLVDTLFATKDNSQKYVDRLWSELLKDFRQTYSNPTENDKLLMTHTVFTIVRKLCCHHWSTKFRDHFFDTLGNTIERELHHISVKDKMEYQQFEQNLTEFSDGLDEWINSYDASEGFLSEQIKETAMGGNNKTKLPSGRKAVNVSEIVNSFSYLPNIADRSARLQAFYGGLRGRYIAPQTDQKTFVNLFQGMTTTEKIVWVGEIKELHYFFDKLEKMKVLTWPAEYSKWQMVCARFQRKVKHKVKNDGMTDDSYVIEDLNTRQFTSGGKIPTNYEGLDAILRILSPQTRYKDVLQDYLDSSGNDQYDISDYRDALANGLNTDVHL